MSVRTVLNITAQPDSSKPEPFLLPLVLGQFAKWRNDPQTQYHYYVKVRSDDCLMLEKPLPQSFVLQYITTIGRGPRIGKHPNLLRSPPGSWVVSDASGHVIAYTHCVACHALSGGFSGCTRHMHRERPHQDGWSIADKDDCGQGQWTKVESVIALLSEVNPNLERARTLERGAAATELHQLQGQLDAATESEPFFF